MTVALCYILVLANHVYRQFDISRQPRSLATLKFDFEGPPKQIQEAGMMRVCVVERHCHRVYLIHPSVSFELCHTIDNRVYGCQAMLVL